MSFLFGKAQAAPTPVLPPVPPVQPAAAVKAPSTEAQDELRSDLRRRKGSADTIVTGGTGLTTEEKVAGASLIGGRIEK